MMKNHILFMLAVMVTGSCKRDVLFQAGDDSIFISTYGQKREVIINSNFSESKIELQAEMAYGVSDAVYICFKPYGRIEVVNPYSRIKAQSLARSHMFRSDIPGDSTGLPDILKYQSGKCISYGFTSSTVYPASYPVQVTTSLRGIPPI